MNEYRKLTIDSNNDNTLNQLFGQFFVRSQRGILPSIGTELHAKFIGIFRKYIECIESKDYSVQTVFKEFQKFLKRLLEEKSPFLGPF